MARGAHQKADRVPLDLRPPLCSVINLHARPRLRVPSTLLPSLLSSLLVLQTKASSPILSRSLVDEEPPTRPPFLGTEPPTSHLSSCPTPVMLCYHMFQAGC